MPPIRELTKVHRKKILIQLTKKNTELSSKFANFLTLIAEISKDQTEI